MERRAASRNLAFVNAGFAAGEAKTSLVSLHSPVPHMTAPPLSVGFIPHRMKKSGPRSSAAARQWQRQGLLCGWWYAARAA
jgi:hypothetical protein